MRIAIIGLVLMLALLVLAFRVFTPYLENYHKDFEYHVGEFIKQPIEIKKISIGNRGLEPVFRFHDVSILAENKRDKLLQANEMELGIDLIGSLVNWKIKPGLLVVKGSKLTINQNKDKRFEIYGVSKNTADIIGNNNSSGNILLWMFDQSKIFLDDIEVNIRLCDGKSLSFKHVYLKLYNDTFHHVLKVVGRLVQEQRSSFFKVDLKSQGNILENKIPSFSGDVLLDGWRFYCNFDGSNTNLSLPSFGSINLLIRNSEVINKTIRQPIHVKKASSNIVWKRNKKGVKISLNDFKFTDGWLSLDGKSELMFLDGSKMPVADVDLGIKLKNMNKAKLYYPASLLPSTALPWLDSAFVDSDLIDGKIILRGPLDKFPFDNSEGKFLVDTKIRNVYLDYDKDWSPAKEITGTMVFANRTMTIIADEAKILGSPTEKIKAVIPNLSMPILHIDGFMSADAKMGLDFVDKSPLKQTVGRKLEHIKLLGPMSFGMNLKMPLSEEIADQKTEVKGVIELNDNLVFSTDFNLNVKNLTGSLDFKNEEVSTKKLTGVMFDRPIDISVSTADVSDDDNITRVDICGKVAVKDFDEVFSSNLESSMEGEFYYKALLELHSVSSVQDVFKFNSDLKGMRIKLPEPFVKLSDQSSKFSLEATFGGNKSSELKFVYADKINGIFKVDKSDDKKFKLLEGDIRLGLDKAKFANKPGLTISGDIAKLDWKVWKSYFSKVNDGAVEAFPSIREASLKIVELNVFGSLFKNITLKVVSKGKDWVLDILSPNIIGKILLPNDKQEPIKGRFKQIYLENKKNNLSKVEVGSLPYLDLIIDDFRYGDNDFHQIEFVGKPQGNIFKIRKINLNSEDFSVKARGEWKEKNGAQSSYFTGSIGIMDLGKTLRSYNLTGSMEGGATEGSFALKWPDSPYKPALKNINGSISIEMQDGRITNLGKETENKIGFGRVLGLLSLQSIPKRLSLDFSDLTKEGFSFTKLEGDFELSRGKAMVQKLDIDGHVAHVKAHGLIGLVSKNYDLMLSVIPKITSSIPVAAAIIGGPLVGALTYVADKVVSTVIKEAINYTYHVTGSWSNPQVDKM